MFFFFLTALLFGLVFFLIPPLKHAENEEWQAAVLTRSVLNKTAILDLHSGCWTCGGKRVSLTSWTIVLIWSWHNISFNHLTLPGQTGGVSLSLLCPVVSLQWGEARAAPRLLPHSLGPARSPAVPHWATFCCSSSGAGRNAGDLKIEEMWRASQQQ